MISKGKVVSIQYVLTDDTGAILDQSEKDSPLDYLHGTGQIIAGLENALEGLKIGDKKKVTVKPEEAYGVIVADLVRTVDKSVFPKDVKVEVGFQFSADIGKDRDAYFTVTKIEGQTVHLDGNHPLAGKTLHFDVEIKGLRDASEEELSHGHAHGPDGHHHH